MIKILENLIQPLQETNDWDSRQQGDISQKKMEQGNMDFKRTRHLTEIPYEFSNPTHCMTSILEKKIGCLEDSSYSKCEWYCRLRYIFSRKSRRRIGEELIRAAQL